MNGKYIIIHNQAKNTICEALFDGIGRWTSAVAITPTTLQQRPPSGVEDFRQKSLGQVNIQKSNPIRIFSPMLNTKKAGPVIG